MKINVVTLFPDYFPGPLGQSITSRAAKAGLVEYNLLDLREFADGGYQTVDDYPYGGGAGMVLKPEPFFRAMDSLGEGPYVGGRVVVMSARGRRFSHSDAVRWSLDEELTILCGHYKDIDQRVVDGLGAEEISLGDFVLTGGEPAALAVIDATVRLLPGAMSDHESASTDSHYDGVISAPSYTRPAEYRGMKVPDVLLSGDHSRIERWRREESERLTRERAAAVQEMDRSSDRAG